MKKHVQTNIEKEVLGGLGRFLEVCLNLSKFCIRRTCIISGTELAWERNDARFLWQINMTQCIDAVAMCVNGYLLSKEQSRFSSLIILLW